MTRRRVLILALAVGILGVVIMSQRPPPAGKGGGSPPLPPDLPRPELVARVEGMGPFVPYQPKGLSLPFSFEYPKNWAAGEERGRSEPYQQILILGPRNAQDTYNAGLVIRMLPTQPRGGRFADVGELTQWRRGQFAAAKAFVVLTDRPRSVEDAAGMELEMQFTAALPLPTMASQDTTLRSHTVIVERDGQLYEFSYSADVRDYQRYYPAFAHLIETLHFLR
jgi:hypothetical protein